METTSKTTSKDLPEHGDIPDRLCRWCQIPMEKRLVAEGRFIHYTCARCIFQHTSKRDTQST